MHIPPFQITPKMLFLVAEIQLILGEVQGFSVEARPSPKLRKENKIRTVHHSLAIEGNTLTENQITALLENKRVLGPQDQIQEVRNALVLYDLLPTLNTFKEKDFLKAHQILMNGLVQNPGKYRNSAVGIVKGSKVSRMAPPAKLVPSLMGNLFQFLKQADEVHFLIKACVFHYELELIHPFMDGNGRMGRIWQQRILMASAPIFQYLAVETWIHHEQKRYYEALEKSDLAGHSNLFIEFSLGLILKELKLFSSSFRPNRLKVEDRINSALEYFGSKTFSRKDYQSLHKSISAPTASRDLARAVMEKRLIVQGTKAKAVYRKRK